MKDATPMEIIPCELIDKRTQDTSSPGSGFLPLKRNIFRMMDMAEIGLQPVKRSGTADAYASVFLNL